MYSIYHFFKNLVQNKQFFLIKESLSNFPYDSSLLSCKSIGKFPDMAIRLNPNSEVFTGGELIELKDSGSYTVSSFNSTIPTGKKAICDVITGINNNIYKQMQAAGDVVDSLPIRDVFYLVRGRNNFNQSTKVCLVHGSFFETIQVQDLIQEAFTQVLNERLLATNEEMSEELKAKLLKLFSEQKSFSKVRDVDQSSVKIRFRIMTEVKAEGNILNSKKYPEILDNTLNLILPCDDSISENEFLRKMSTTFNQNLNIFQTFKIKHHFNGYFLVFQSPLLN